MLDPTTITQWASKAIAGIAGAAVLGLGSTVVANRTDIIHLQDEIATIVDLKGDLNKQRESMDRQQVTLEKLSKNVAVLVDREKRREQRHEQSK